MRWEEWGWSFGELTCVTWKFIKQCICCTYVKMPMSHSTFIGIRWIIVNPQLIRLNGFYGIGGWDGYERRAKHAKGSFNGLGSAGKMALMASISDLHSFSILFAARWYMYFFMYFALYLYFSCNVFCICRRVDNAVRATPLGCNGGEKPVFELLQINCGQQIL